MVLGCSANVVLDRIVRPEDDKFARAYVDSVRFGRLDYATSILAPALAQMPGVRDSLANIARYLPKGPLDSFHIIGANRFVTANVDRVELTYEFRSPDGWGLASVTSATELGVRYVEGVHANRLARPLEEQNAFTIRGKSPAHFLMLAIAIACFAASVAAIIAAVRTPMPRRWLWALLPLIGAGTINFNWTTGASGFQLLRLQLLSAGILRMGVAAPWIIQAAFPIGALLTFAKVGAIRRGTADTEKREPQDL